MIKIDFLNNKKAMILIPLVFYMFWVIGFYSEYEMLVENVALLLVGIIALICLILSRNTNNLIPLIMYVPFMFSREITPITMPTMIYVACGCLVIGLIYHFVKYKPKFKMGTLFYGICILGLAMVLGGITTGADYLLFQFFIVLFAVIMFVLVYLYFISSSEKVSFHNISVLMTVLGCFLCLQSLTFYLFSGDFWSFIANKTLEVGWGVSNNIALMLLLTSPFTWYLNVKDTGKKAWLWCGLFFLQALVIIVSHCRGGMFSLFIEIIALYVAFPLFKAKDKKIFKKVFLSFGIIVAFFVISMLVIRIVDKELFDLFVDVAFNINLENLNGRTDVYKYALNGLKDNLFFGKGVLYSLYEDHILSDDYMWGHSDIIQTLSTMGIFGLLAFLYHTFEKFYVLLRKINVEKVAVIAAYTASGIYGLADISYYFINYMVVLFIIFIICEPYFYNYRENKKIIKETNIEKGLEN